MALESPYASTTSGASSSLRSGGFSGATIGATGGADGPSIGPAPTGAAAASSGGTTGSAAASTGGGFSVSQAASAVGQGAATGARSSKALQNEVSLIVNGVRYLGWQSVRVTRGLDRVPGDFEIAVTEKFPGQASEVIVTPGQPCQLLFGVDVVITGFVDRWMSAISPNAHTVRIIGRSKCEDLVDCSITSDEINGSTMQTSSLLDLATKLATPYHISVSSLTGDNVPVSAGNGAPLAFSANLTETPYDIIERVARYAGVLAYDDGSGNLVLANVATSAMASGIEQGVNVQSASFATTLDQRYSVYLPMLMSTNFFGTEGAGAPLFAPAYDKGVPRYRPLVIVSEQFQFGVSMAERRAQWEAARRYGRSQMVRAIVDSWRDVKGTLWTPNATIPISLPSLKLTQQSDPWVIGEVTFNRNDEGTTADILAMPKSAFLPQPEILVPFRWDPTNTPSPGSGAAALAGDAASSAAGTAAGSAVGVGGASIGTATGNTGGGSTRGTPNL